MSVRKILKLGDPILRKPSEEVTEEEIKEKDFKKLIRDMFDTMKHAEGLGLAAPQIGILKKLIVIGSEKSDRYPDSPNIPEKVIINPKITILDSPLSGYWEGCLSVPQMRGLVERPSKISIEYFDEKWNKYNEVIEGFQAVVFQHEIDHLSGILYVDRLKDTKLFGFIDALDETEDNLD
ncbi:MAG: peptide deformylase [Leptospiraceae bacterium]|nr:peptide deformylase [Leptospiraceae bacterium]MCK6381427.1 peptide deformylase [Leptospiraceae bacterium]